MGFLSTALGFMGTSDESGEPEQRLSPKALKLIEILEVTFSDLSPTLASQFGAIEFILRRQLTDYTDEEIVSTLVTARGLIDEVINGPHMEVLPLAEIEDLDGERS